MGKDKDKDKNKSNKKKKQKQKQRNKWRRHLQRGNSASSTSTSASTQSSATTSTADDSAHLLPGGSGGACGGISDTRELRRPHRTEDRRRTDVVESSTLGRGATGGRFRRQDAVDSSSNDNLVVPDDSGELNYSNSPSKMNIFARLKKSLSPSKKYTSLSLECNCGDKSNHEPDCFELKKLQGEPKRKSKSPNKSPSSTAPPVSSKKSENVLQSSNVSGAAAAECSRVSAPHVDPPGMDYLKVPTESDEGRVSPSGRKKSIFAQIKSKFSPKRSPVRPDWNSDKSDHGSNWPERRTCETGARSKFPNRSPNRSKTSSSRPFPYTKINEERDTSNASPGKSKDSKSSRNLDLDFKERLNIDTNNSTSKSSSSSASPKISQDYDPGEGTSSGTVAYRRFLNFEDCWQQWVEDYVGDVPEGTIPLIEIEDIDDIYESSGEEEFTSIPIPRRRCKSWGSRYHIRIITDDRSQNVGPQPHDIQQGDEASGPGPSLGRRNPRDQLVLSTSQSRSYARTPNVRQPRASGPSPVVRRNQSGVGNRPRPRSVSPVHPAQRCRSLSANRFGCICKNPYFHNVGCPIHPFLRQRRKYRKCKLDVPFYPKK